MCLLHQLEELLQYAPLRAFYAQHARELYIQILVLRIHVVA